MRVAITGGTGFIGQRLVPELMDAGHEVLLLTRSPDGANAGMWAEKGLEVRSYDPYDVDSVTEAIEGAEAIINLAGAGVADARWSKAYKEQIRRSRVATTNLLVDAMGKQETPPKVLLSGSAIGYYGPREADEPCREDEHDATQFAPRDFLSGVCREWERSARRASLLGARVVRLRIGVVLGHGGGALAKMEPLFRKCLGAPLAPGTQMMSWIHRTDLVKLILFALATPSLEGPLNCTAPNPVSNKEFSKTLASVLNRPCLPSVPYPMVRLKEGPIAKMLVTGQKVLPTKALEAGFNFEFPTLREALEDLYRRSTSIEAPSAGAVAAS